MLKVTAANWVIVYLGGHVETDVDQHDTMRRLFDLHRFRLGHHAQMRTKLGTSTRLFVSECAVTHQLLMPFQATVYHLNLLDGTHAVLPCLMLEVITHQSLTI